MKCVSFSLCKKRRYLIVCAQCAYVIIFNSALVVNRMERKIILKSFETSKKIEKASEMQQPSCKSKSFGLVL